MAYLKKRGKYYYAKWHTSIDGKKSSVRKALGTRHKDVAQKMLKELQELELPGKVDPFAPGFDPKEALKGGNPVFINGELYYLSCPNHKPERRLNTDYKRSDYQA